VSAAILGVNCLTALLQIVILWRIYKAWQVPF
jgi:hypothetical protein